MTASGKTSQTSFKSERFFTHAWKNTGNKSINEVTSGLKNPGIGTDYSMAVICVEEFRNQGGVTAYKAASNKIDD